MPLCIELNQDFRAANHQKVIPSLPPSQGEYEPEAIAGRRREFDAQRELFAKFRSKAKVRR